MVRMEMASCVLWIAACAGSATGPAPTTKRAQAEEEAAVKLLQAGSFDAAAEAAARLLAVDAHDAPAHAILAVTRFKKAARQLSTDFRTLIAGVLGGGGVNHEYLRFAGERLDRELAAAARDLDDAAVDRGFALELCVACWQVDWNENGRFDDRDARLFQIEMDADGHPFPDSDPRRMPTFRFDRGDLYWALAFIDFQRAALNIILAYKYTDVDQWMRRGGEPEGITLRLDDRGRIAAARELILGGLANAERARTEYLAETDDDREWVPNPRQASHPLPLPVDEALYRTWQDVTGDLRRLLKSEEGIDVAELARLSEPRHPPPRGYLDVGRLFSQPHDVVLRTRAIDQFDRDPQAVLRDFFGSGYVPTMKASPLIGRLGRMKHEVQRGEESFERKLRYLLWLN